MNKNYVKGRNFEYRVIYFLRKIGYYCLRAYGSKGLYDIIAVPPKNNKGIKNYPLGIQAKYNGYIHPKELEKLQKESKWQLFPLIAYSDNHKLSFKSLNGEKISLEGLNHVR